MKRRRLFQAVAGLLLPAAAQAATQTDPLEKWAAFSDNDLKILMLFMLAYTSPQYRRRYATVFEPEANTWLDEIQAVLKQRQAV